MIPTRLLVRLPNWLGDIVMALPALHAVRTAWPDAALSVALPTAFAPLAALLPGVDGVVELSGRSWRARAAYSGDLVAVREGSFDTALLFTNSFASAWMLWQAGVPARWGYGADWRSPLLTRSVRRHRPRTNWDRHHSRYYGRLVEALDCPVEGYEVRLAVPDDWRGRAQSSLRSHGVPEDTPVVGFAPGAAYGSAKQWSPTGIASVVARCRDMGAACVLLGTAADAQAGAAIEAALGPGACVNLVGRTDLPALVGVMSQCASFVCNDSGGMHLAAAIGVPVVAIFGATDERATAPLGPHTVIAGRSWCRPCLRRECPIDHRCMTSIEPARVVDAIVENLHS